MECISENLVVVGFWGGVGVSCTILDDSNCILECNVIECTCESHFPFILGGVKVGQVKSA